MISCVSFTCCQLGLGSREQKYVPAGCLFIKKYFKICTSRLIIFQKIFKYGYLQVCRRVEYINTSRMRVAEYMQMSTWKMFLGGD